MRVAFLVGGLLLLGGAFVAGHLLASRSASDEVADARAEAAAAAARVETLRASLDDAHELAMDQKWWIDHTSRPGDCVLPLPRDLPSAGAASARILAADPKHGVYVISQGSEDGIQVGTQCLITRDGLYLAILEITDVQIRQAAGRITRRGSKAAIARGDHVLVDRSRVR